MVYLLLPGPQLRYITTRNKINLEVKWMKCDRTSKENDEDDNNNKKYSTTASRLYKSDKYL